MKFVKVLALWLLIVVLVTGCDIKVTHSTGSSYTGSLGNSDIRTVLQSAAKSYAPEDPEYSEFYTDLAAISYTESRWNPAAVGDNGCSVGLFQNNWCAGRGYGYSVEALQNPSFNANLAAADLIIYYRQAKTQGLRGADVAVYMSRYGQRPASGLWENVRPHYSFVPLSLL